MGTEDDFKLDETLGDINTGRRQFVKGLVGTTAFAVPFIASYDLSSLSSGVAKAASIPCTY